MEQKPCTITVTKKKKSGKKGPKEHNFKDLFACGCLVYMTVKIYELARMEIAEDYLCRWILYLIDEIKKDGL